MSEITLENIPTVSLGQMIETLSDLYVSSIESDFPFKSLPSVMLWGAPGVGKSQAVRRIAQSIRKATGKETRVQDVRLLLFNPIDLRGIPTSNGDKTLAIWLRPQIFDMDPDESIINILFLDEITAAPQSVQAAAYQITLDRVVGEHALPDNCIVIAAGNRTTDKSISYKMPKALANRLLHFQIEGNFDSWREWAVQAGIHEKVIGFLSFRRDLLMTFDPTDNDLAFATPRSWEMVSNVLAQYEGSIEAAYPLIAGLVGTGIAIEFRSWEKVYDSLPSMEDIFEGRNPSHPIGTDTLYALISAMLGYARTVKNDIPRITNSIKYADGLPPDFSTILMKDYMALDEGYRELLITIPEFSQWLRDKGRLLNGN